MSNLYSETLEQLGRIQPVTIETVIHGEAGDIATGLRRELRKGVTPVIDPKGRSFARVTAEYDGDTLTVSSWGWECKISIAELRHFNVILHFYSITLENQGDIV